jgi:proteasome lid subunit RPN8/RPN11
VSSSIQIETNVVRLMIGYARQEPQIECCGLLAGTAGRITRAFPAENVAANPATAYEIATKQIVHLTREIRLASLELLGIYHSHPNGKSEPSETDISSACYPDVAYFIVSPAPNAAAPARAFSIRDGRVSELELRAV